jgi:hypothetical protein
MLWPYATALAAFLDRYGEVSGTAEEMKASNKVESA